MRHILYTLMICVAALWIAVEVNAAAPVKIGAIFAKTGPAGANNRNYFQAARFAVEKLNAGGGVAGRSVELLEFDNQSTALGARAAAKEAVSAEVVAVVGAVWSSHSLAMASVFQQAKIPMITPASTHPDITKTGDYIYRVCFIDTFQGAALARFARSYLHAKTVAIMTNADNRYSLGLSKSFGSRFRAIGGEIVRAMDYLNNITDIKALCMQISAANPDIVFLPDYDDTAAAIIRQAREAGVTSVFLGGDGWNELMYDYAGDAVAGNYYAEHWHPDYASEASRAFVAQYEKEYGKIKTPGVALVYDAFSFLAMAIASAGAEDPERIKAALSEIRTFRGVTGNFKYGADGDPEKTVLILQFRNGGSKLIDVIEP